jgi:hypothetical protein
LPVADCVASGSDPYVLAIWARLDGDVYYSLWTQSFNAICSNQTDCDAPRGYGGRFLAGAGYPVLSSPVGEGSQPTLAGKVGKKTGRFAALPEMIRLIWNSGQQGWTWTSDQPECGSYLLLPYKDWYLLHSTVSNPPLIPARADSSQKPLHLIFEVAAMGKAGKEEGFLLDVKEGSSSG